MGPTRVESRASPASWPEPAKELREGGTHAGHGVERTRFGELTAELSGLLLAGVLVGPLLEQLLGLASPQALGRLGR